MVLLRIIFLGTEMGDGDHSKRKTNRQIKLEARVQVKSMGASTGSGKGVLIFSVDGKLLDSVPVFMFLGCPLSKTGKLFTRMSQPRASGR